MCNCINIEIGSYGNQTILEYPDWFVGGKRSAGIDNCLLEEIKGLWEMKIQTLESCCGHNRIPGYIAVIPEHADLMLWLGYKPIDDMVGVYEPKTTYQQ